MKVHGECRYHATRCTADAAALAIANYALSTGAPLPSQRPPRRAEILTDLQQNMIKRLKSRKPCASGYSFVLVRGNAFRTMKYGRLGTHHTAEATALAIAKFQWQSFEAELDRAMCDRPTKKAKKSPCEVQCDQCERWSSVDKAPPGELWFCEGCRHDNRQC